MTRAEAWKALSNGEIVTHDGIDGCPIKQTGDYISSDYGFIHSELKFNFFHSKQNIEFDNNWRYYVPRPVMNGYF